MKTSRVLLCLPALIALAGCSHSRRIAEPVAATGHGCVLGNMWLGPLVTDQDDPQKFALEEYASSILKARQLGEYVDCVDKGGSPEDRKLPPQARKWLDSTRADVDRAKARYPEVKRIVDVVLTYSDIDEKLSQRRMIITLRDGEKTTIDRRFPRSPAPSAARPSP